MPRLLLMVILSVEVIRSLTANRIRDGDHMGWDTDWDIDLNPFDDVIDSVTDYVADKSDILASALTLKNIFSVNTLYAVGSSNLAGAAAMTVIGSQIGNEKMTRKGLEGLMTVGLKDEVAFLLPEPLRQWLLSNTGKASGFIWNNALSKSAAGKGKQSNFNRMRGSGSSSVNPSPMAPQGVSYTSSYLGNHPAGPLVAKHRMEIASSRNVCLRCYRSRHVTIQCYADTDIRGRKLMISQEAKEILMEMSGGIRSPLQNTTFGFGGGGGDGGSSLSSPRESIGSI